VNIKPNHLENTATHWESAKLTTLLGDIVTTSKSRRKLNNTFEEKITNSQLYEKSMRTDIAVTLNIRSVDRCAKRYDRPCTAQFFLSRRFYFSSHHSFSLRTCSSSAGVKSFLMLNVFLISSGVLPLIILATVLHVTSSKPLMSR